jgi:hypothetical protein
MYDLYIYIAVYHLKIGIKLDIFTQDFPPKTLIPAPLQPGPSAQSCVSGCLPLPRHDLRLEESLKSHSFPKGAVDPLGVSINGGAPIDGWWKIPIE